MKHEKFIPLILAFFLGCISCSDQKLAEFEPASIKYQKEAMKTILTLSENSGFRNFITSKSIEQEHGDYTVRLVEIVKYLELNSMFSAAETIKKLSNNLKNETGQIPHVFYPRAETIEDEMGKTKGKGGRIENVEPPVGVIDDGSGTSTPPGYIVDTNGTLTFYANITESYAWENDVWVFGYEEQLASDNMIPAQEAAPPIEARINGEGEYFGIVKVTDLGAIEPWINGKVEFRIDVFAANGAVIKSPYRPGKVKRKYLRDAAIYDMNKFLVYWNASNIGNWMIEGWIEEDGGTSTTTISQSFPAACTGCPTTNISLTKQKSDLDMGRTMIQFSDPKTQWYGVSYADIKHK